MICHGYHLQCLTAAVIININIQDVKYTLLKNELPMIQLSAGQSEALMLLMVISEAQVYCFI